MKVQKLLKHLVNTQTLKISFYGCLLIAILVIRCESDRNAQNVDVQNPLANPQDGPAAGNPNGITGLNKSVYFGCILRAFLMADSTSGSMTL